MAFLYSVPELVNVILLLIFGGIALVVLVGCVIGFVLVPIVSFLAAGAALRKWWYMRRIDPAETATIEEGVQEISGTARPVGRPGPARFSNEDTLAYQYAIEKDNRNGPRSRLYAEAGGYPFEVDVGGTAVAVDPEGAQFFVEKDFQVSTDGTDDVPRGVQEYVDDPDEPLNPRFGPIEFGSQTHPAGTRWFVEERIDPGDRVYVLGNVRRDPTRVPSGASSQYVVSGSHDSILKRLFATPLVISDSTAKGLARQQLKNGAKRIALGLFLGAFGVPLVAWLVLFVRELFFT